MHVEHTTDVEGFLERATPFLLEDEARHNLIFGIVDTLTRHPARYPAHDLWLVIEDGLVVGTALQTPPYNLLLARPATTGVIDALAAAIQAAGRALPGVTAAQPEVEEFAEAWCGLTADRWSRRLHQGVYRLRQVRPTLVAPGGCRAADLDDRELLLSWFRAFHGEATPRSVDDDELAAGVDQRLPATAADGLWVWEDGGRAVSMCGYGGPTPTGTRIGPVYTPPESRGYGYATSLVAAVSRAQLAAGRRFCFLYTDLANLTSNAIYRRIGYEQICSSAELAFHR